LDKNPKPPPVCSNSLQDDRGKETELNSEFSVFGFETSTGVPF